MYCLFIIAGSCWHCFTHFSIQLLHIFVAERLSSFMTFYQENKVFVSNLGKKVLSTVGTAFYTIRSALITHLIVVSVANNILCALAICIISNTIDLTHNIASLSFLP